MQETIVFDLESDGLIDDVSQIWCATAYNLDRDKFVLFSPEHRPIETLPRFLSLGARVVCHNLIKYDREVIAKILGYLIPLELCYDTYILSTMMYPDIAEHPGIKGKHSLAAWGGRFGRPKPVHEDWSRFSPEMMHRNIEDVKINAELWTKKIAPKLEI
jgi:hypothetical protein